MLESEQRKAVLTRKQLADLQASLDLSEVARSVQGVPGVSPAVVIEAMSGQFMELNQQNAKQKNRIAELQTQLRSLQQVMAKQARKAETDRDRGRERDKELRSSAGSGHGQSRGLRTSVRSMSPSPTPLRASRSLATSGGRGLHDLDFDAAPDGDGGDGEGEGEGGLFEDFIEGGSAAQPFAIIVDGETSPQKVLHMCTILTVLLMIVNSCCCRAAVARA